MKQNEKTDRQLGYLSLVFLVISAMVGGGIFNLPQSAATGASPAALCVGWLTTGIGVFSLVSMFRILSRIEPKLTNGLYTYAETGFGKFVSFLVAYGYWICNCVATVAYGILIASTLNSFFPGLFAGGTTWESILLISGIIWVIFAVNLTGANHTAIANSVGTIIKFIPIILFILLFLLSFQPAEFAAHFAEAPLVNGAALPFSEQVANSFFVTVFLFIGIEGAVVVSGTARNQKVVAKATIVSYLITIAVYVVVSMLAFGLFSGAEIAQMKTPSVATLMQTQVGGIASIIVSVGIMISVASSWLVWILMLGQMPLYAARDGVFPKFFAEQNKRDAPKWALFVTCVIMEVVLLLIREIGEASWDFLVKLTPIIAMPCYFVCCLFLFKLAFLGKHHWTHHDNRHKSLAVAILGIAFTVLVMASSKPQLLLLTCTIYACGLPIFIWARFHRKTQGVAGDLREPLFRSHELVLAIALVVFGAFGLFTLF